MTTSDQPAHRFAQTALVHVPGVYRLARRLSGCADLAADLTQETFLQAWRSFDRFEPGTNCRAWLYRILLHVWSHERRRRIREPVLFDSVTADGAITVDEPAVPQHLTEAQVLEALDRLPPGQRSIVILADVEDLSYREISETLAIPIGTVMSRLSRARSALRTLLADYAEDVGLRSRAVRAARGKW